MTYQEPTDEMLVRVRNEALREEVRAANEGMDGPIGGAEEETPAESWPPSPHFRLLEVPTEEPFGMGFGHEVEVAEYHHDPPGWAITITITKVYSSPHQEAYAVKVGEEYHRDYFGGIIMYPAGRPGWRAARMSAADALVHLIASDIGRWRAEIAQS